MKWLIVVAAVVVVAVASALGGYAVGRHRHSDKAERQTALADALEIIGAYNASGSGDQGHLVWLGKAAPHIWRFRVKANGQKSYGCLQVNVSQFWHGQGTSFHGVGTVDPRQCPPWAGRA